MDRSERRKGSSEWPGGRKNANTKDDDDDNDENNLQDSTIIIMTTAAAIIQLVSSRLIRALAGREAI